MIAAGVALEKILACPRCHGGLERRPEALACGTPGCGFRGVIADGIVNVLPAAAGPSFFDATYPVMMHSSSGPSRLVFYSQQAAALRERLAGARLVLDVGCGPRLEYERPPASLVIGLDLSYESLRHNTDVDVRLYGSATSLPLPAGSMDAIVCFYSLHHLVGQTVHENEALLRAALREFARVLKPGADLLVFEVAPWWATWKVQRLAWNIARRKLGRSLDMFFWRRQTLTALASELLPPGTRLEYRAIRIPPFTVFPFAFALQRLQLPRLFYPFAISMYDWRVGQIA